MDGSGEPRRIRTFHPRRGRMSPTAVSAMSRLLPGWGIDLESAPADLSTVFSPTRPTVLEIGSGMGMATVTMALADADTGIVAVDVHTPGIGALLAACEQQSVGNVRVCIGDAVELMDRLAPATLAGIRAFFPDPWPKARHHKRRLVQPAFVRRAAQLLAPGGALHCATDIPGYADQMLSVCTAEPALDVGPGLIERPAWRPLTAYEKRGLAAGRSAQDLIATRR